ncbi:MAG: plastocyanin/azurin family copper-binding protein [Gemmatimonadaceae bacterium]
MYTRRVLVTSFVIAAVVACGRKETATPDTASAPSAPTSTTAPAATPTGKVVVVELNSDGSGNYFKPADFEVHRGDVIRFTLKSGVHNVHFLPDSNPGKSNLPPASDMLQLPDQTLDVPVNFEPGAYYFQCDPHALLGMKGHVKVEN